MDIFFAANGNGATLWCY